MKLSFDKLGNIVEVYICAICTMRTIHKDRFDSHDCVDYLDLEKENGN